MKKLLILILLLISSICYSQTGLGWTKEKIFILAGTTKIKEISPGVECVAAVSIPDNTLNIISRGFLFRTGGNTCTAVIETYSLKDLNDRISWLNNKFVKLEELKWKDYSTGIVMSIDIDDKDYTIFFEIPH